MLKRFIIFALFIVAGGWYAGPLYAKAGVQGSLVNQSNTKSSLHPPFVKGEEGGLENIVVRDDTGRKVSIQIPVKRVVTLAPSNTDIVTALGMTSSIVGASNTDDNPLPDSVKRVGFVNPSIEEIVSLNPSLVMGIYGEDMVCNRLERLNIPCIILSPGNLEGVMHDIRLAGRLFSADDRASVIVETMKQTIDRVQARLSHCTTEPLVYFEIDGSDPSRPFSAGKGSFIDSLITMAHAVNVAHTTNTLWPQLSSEYILARNPDVIIVSDKLDRDALKQRQGWSGIKAIKNKRVYTIDVNLVSQPGPDIVNAFVAIARDIHPQVFKNNNNGTDKSPLPPFTKGGRGGIIEQTPEGTNNQ